MNLIEEYASALSKYTDAPLLFVKASAYYLISTLCGAHVRCTWIPGRSGVMANEWFLISGLPLITRKSTVLTEITHIFEDVYREVLRRATGDVLGYDEDILHTLTSAEESNTRESAEDIILKNMIMEVGTPEGIVDRITKKHTVTFNRFTMVSSEWGGIIEQMKKKDYMAGYRSLLSKLYYGERYSMDRSSSSEKNKEALVVRQLPANYYVTALVGMQEPYLYFEPEDLIQGLLRRFVIIHCTPEEKEFHLPWLDPARADKRRAIDKLRAAMIKRSTAYFSSDPNRRIEAIPTPEVYDAVNDLSKGAEKELKRDPSTTNLYKQSKFEHVFKLAMLNAIASSDPIERVIGISQSPYIMVNYDHFSSALSYYDEILQKSELVIASIKSSIRDRPYISADGVLLMIQAHIRRGGANGVSVSKLLGTSRIFYTELKAAVITLMVSEKIIMKALPKASGGGLDMIAYDPSFCNCSPSDIIVDYNTFMSNF